MAESEIDLVVARAALQRTAALLDDELAPAAAAADTDDLHSLMKEVQCTNVAVKRAAIAIVDRALTATGGAGYLSTNRLSRLYRDVRASTFMQPFSALDANEYIGNVALRAGTWGL